MSTNTMENKWLYPLKDMFTVYRICLKKERIAVLSEEVFNKNRKQMIKEMQKFRFLFFGLFFFFFPILIESFCLVVCLFMSTNKMENKWLYVIC